MKEGNARLVREFLAGSVRAQTRVYEMLQELAGRECTSIGRRFGETVRPTDLAHSAWVELFDTLRRYDDSRPLRPYLAGLVRMMARRAVEEFLRVRLWTLRRLDAREPPRSEEEIDPVGQAALANFVLRVTIPKLQERQKPVARLHYVAGHSPEFIADVLSRPVRAVYEALGRIRKRILADVEEYVGACVPLSARERRRLRERFEGEQTSP